MTRPVSSWVENVCDVVNMGIIVRNRREEGRDLEEGWEQRIEAGRGHPVLAGHAGNGT